MKQTVNVNICQSQFILDIDAFEMLNDYLDTLSKVFARNPDRNELISDIENRIAELLLDQISLSAPVVTLQAMESVIAQIGRPQDLSETEEIIQDTPDGEQVFRRQVFTQTPPPPPVAVPVRKRLYRSASDKMLGGVCGGIAAYFGVDPTWIRLATVALCFLSFSMVGLVYLVLWIVVPEATSPLEQMQMRGQQPTLSNIADSVSSNFRPDGAVSAAAPARSAGSFANTLGRIAGVIAYVILGIVTLTIGAAALFFFVIFIIGLVGCFQFWITGTVSELFLAACDVETLNIMPVTAIAFFMFLILAIPTFVLARLILNKNSNSSNASKVALLLIWLASIVAIIIASTLWIA